MQLVLPWRGPVSRVSRKPSVLQVGADIYPIAIARHRRARRFVLRMTADGGLRLTVPRGASIADGLAFAKTQGPWIARERSRRAEAAAPWAAGTLVWFRGVQVPLSVGPSSVSWATETAPRAPSHGIVGRGFTPRLARGDLSLSKVSRADLAAGPNAVRDVVETHLRRLAGTELPPRCQELAARHGLTITRVTIRNQRTRWGSCSARGAISLNWRLIQMPPDVADYVILHELMHLKQPNHSRKFWREVAAVCDHWRESERWLRQHGKGML